MGQTALQGSAYRLRRLVIFSQEDGNSLLRCLFPDRSLQRMSATLVVNASRHVSMAAQWQQWLASEANEGLCTDVPDCCCWQCSTCIYWPLVIDEVRNTELPLHCNSL
jgi:hypothetical protein